MKLKNNHLKSIILTAGLFSYSAVSTANNLSAGSLFVGSTPGDPEIKSLLTINPEKAVDFIRWKLILNQSANDSKTYVLNITF